MAIAFESRASLATRYKERKHTGNAPNRYLREPNESHGIELIFNSRSPLSRTELFAFHTNPDNLKVLLDGWKSSQIISTEGHIRPGAQVHVRESIGPFRFHLILEHFLYEQPHRFGERMVKGIFKKFEHIHEFFDVEGEPGVTEVRDRITVKFPWRLAGALTIKFVMARRLRKIFEFRRDA
ncbi:MAG: ligand-binding SRPBCC domain-containing protein [Planctomycetota bacterium]